MVILFVLLLFYKDIWIDHHVDFETYYAHPVEEHQWELFDAQELQYMESHPGLPPGFYWVPQLAIFLVVVEQLNRMQILQSLKGAPAG